MADALPTLLTLLADELEAALELAASAGVSENLAEIEAHSRNATALAAAAALTATRLGDAP